MGKNSFLLAVASMFNILHFVGSMVTDTGKHKRQLRAMRGLEFPSMLTYQAEEYSNKDQADLERKEHDFFGWGYMDFDDRGFIEWNNITAFAGETDYVLRIRYAVDDRRGRACKLFVNDVGQEVATLPFPDTGGYGEWEYEQAIVPLHQGENLIRIEARSKGPHIDNIDVTLYTPAPSPRPTYSASPSSSPTVSFQPSMSPAPTTTVPPTSLTAVRPFQFKLFFEEGMKWQGTYAPRAWCAECISSCEKTGAEVQIEKCDKKEKYQKWLYKDGRIMSAVKQHMCIEWKLPDKKRVRIEKCDLNNDRQLWEGFSSAGKFQLKPIHFLDQCLTQGHHPKSGEYLYLVSCEESLVGDGTLMDPYDDTSHWIIGEWSGHSDKGEPYIFRPGDDERPRGST